MRGRARTESQRVRRHPARSVARLWRFGAAAISGHVCRAVTPLCPFPPVLLNRTRSRAGAKAGRRGSALSFSGFTAVPWFQRPSLPAHRPRGPSPDPPPHPGPVFRPRRRTGPHRLRPQLAWRLRPRAGFRPLGRTRRHGVALAVLQQPLHSAAKCRARLPARQSGPLHRAELVHHPRKHRKNFPASTEAIDRCNLLPSSGGTRDYPFPSRASRLRVSQTGEGKGRTRRREGAKAAWAAIGSAFPLAQNVQEGAGERRPYGSDYSSPVSRSAWVTIRCSDSSSGFSGGRTCANSIRPSSASAYFIRACAFCPGR